MTKFLSSKKNNKQPRQPQLLLSKSMLKASLLASAIILPTFSEVVSAEVSADIPTAITENNDNTETTNNNSEEVKEAVTVQELTEEEEILRKQLITEAESLIDEGMLALTDTKLEALTLEELDELITESIADSQNETVSGDVELEAQEERATGTSLPEKNEDIQTEESEDEIIEEDTGESVSEEEREVEETEDTPDDLENADTEQENEEELETVSDHSTSEENLEKASEVVEKNPTSKASENPKLKMEEVSGEDEVIDADEKEVQPQSKGEEEVKTDANELEEDAEVINTDDTGSEEVSEVVLEEDDINIETDEQTEVEDEELEVELEEDPADIDTYEIEADQQSEIEDEISEAEAEFFTISETVNVDNEEMVVAQTFSLNQSEPVQIAAYSADEPADVKYFDIQTDSAFLNRIAPHAVEVAGEYKLYPSVMMAQAALESGYGGSDLSDPPYHNLFGIKGGYNGDSVTMYTREYTNNGWIYIPQNFRSYPSYSESLEDNAQLLRNGLTWNPGYYSGTWVENTNSYRDATQWLQGRYATDPRYASKLNNIITRYGLDRYDNALYNSGVQDPQFVWEDLKKDEPVTDRSVHTVVWGDTLNRIASEYNTTVSKLKEENNLNSDLIVVGQKLLVGTKEGASKPETPAPKPSQNNSSNGTTHTVVYGDTLSGLANRYNTTVSKIKADNNLNSDLIVVGQTLTVSGSQSQSTPQPSQNNSSNSTTHTVVYGDTLSGLASRYNTTVSKIKADNNLNSDLIVVGQTLTVGGSQSRPSQNSSSNGTTHTVVYGDTLSGLASRYNTTVSKIKADNNLSSDTIYVGQTLTVGGKSGASPQASRNNTTYTVVYGDTLSDLAYRYNTTVSKIKRDNRLSSDTIYVGQELKI